MKLPQLDCGDNFLSIKCRPLCQSYPPLATNLPLYYEGATPPRPDPGHLLSVVSGVAKRAATKTPVPNRAMLRGLKRYVDLWLRRNLRPLTADEVYSFDEWLNQTTYSLDRKLELAALFGENNKPSIRQVRKVKCFVKDETYVAYKYPRGIYSRSDLAKCLFGPLVASVSDKVFALKWFIKKIPVVDRPMAIYERLYKPGAKYASTDYTSFESHFKKIIQDSIENRLFRYMFKNLPAFKGAVGMMEKVKGEDQHLIFKCFSATLTAFRCSGEMDTSLSNGFANLMLWLYASHLKGCPEAKVFGYFEGDDGATRNDGPCPTEKDFADLGFTIKIEMNDILSEASFCGQVYDIEDLAVVTDVREQVCRLGWTNKKYVNSGAQVKEELLRARGYSLLYQYTNCPILGVLGSKILELTDGCVVRQSIIDLMDEWERSRYYEARDRLRNGLPLPNVGLNTRNLVEKLYSVTVNEQLAIEKSISSMTYGPLPFEFSMIPKDWVDYYDRYVVDSLQLAPTWIKSDDRRLYNNLLSAGVPFRDAASSLRGVD